MSNALDAYNPTFYAQNALTQLELALGMTRRVYMGYDEERKSVEEGDTIEVRVPSSFVVQDGGNGTVQDTKTDKIQMKLDQWKEVKFGMTDKELALSHNKIIEEHIRPAILPLAVFVENYLTNLYRAVPYSYNMASSFDVTDITGARKVVRDNAGAVIDDVIMSCAVDSTLEAAMLSSTIFHSAGVTGENRNQNALIKGHLGQRFGTEFFVQQTLPTHTGGTVLTGADQAGTLTGAHAKGATAIAIADLAGVETLKAGDSFYFATAPTVRYAVTGDVTLTAGAAAGVGIFPALKADVADTTVITFEADGASNHCASFATNLMFHKNAFAVAFGRLPKIGHGAGARMSVVQDPVTGLAIRSRIAYIDGSAKVVITFDILFGGKCIRPELACVMRRNV
ncbi:MAG: P22 phage major capsid protein family protein [Pseudomonadota bacterium]